MTTAVRVMIVCGLLLILTAGAAIYMNERELRVRSEQAAADKQKIIDAQNETIRQSQTAQKQIEKEHADALAEIAHERAAVKTPDQAVRAILDLIPGLGPLVVQRPQASVSNQTADKSGTPAATDGFAKLSPEQIMTLFNFGESCKECTANLKAEKSNAVELRAQLLATNAKVEAAEGQRDDYKRALKGGTFMERVKKDAKHGAGAGIGAAAGAAVCSKSSGPVIAACSGIGALTGFLVAHF